MGEPLVLQLFVASSVPVVKILLICGIGAFCARKGLLTPEGRRVLGALSFLVFNPALIFVKLASTLTPARLLHWWPLVLNTGISTAVGLGLGYLGVRLVQPPHHLRPHTIVAIALGNLGNLPLVIVSTLATSSASVLRGIPPSRAEDLAVSYVVVGLLLPCIAHATIGFSMLRKPNVAVLPEPKDVAAAGAGAAADDDVGDGNGRASGGADGMAPTTPRTAALVAVAQAAARAEAADKAAAEGAAAASADDPLGSPCFKTLDSLVLQKRQQRQPLLAREQQLSSSSSYRGGVEGGMRATADAGGPLLLTAPPAPPSVLSSLPPSASSSSLPTAAAASAASAPPSGKSSSSGLYESTIGTVGTAASAETDAEAERDAKSRAGLASARGQGYDTYGNDDDHAPLLAAREGPSAAAGVGSSRGRDGPCSHGVPCVGVGDSGRGGEGPGTGCTPGGMDVGFFTERSMGMRALGCAVDCLGQDGATQGSSGHRVRFAGPQRVVDDDNGNARTDSTWAASPSGRHSSVVELPSLEGARVVPGRPGSFSRLLQSASGRHTLGRLTRSSSGRRFLLEWPSRVNWRAVGRHVLREATSPPLLAILLSVPVGCIRPLQQAFFGPGEPGSGAGRGGAPLGLVTDCLAMLGDCTIPSILVILGATLANGPGAARVPLRVVSLVTLTRLALLPLLGLGLVMGAYAARLFEAPDPIYLLVLLIQNTAPTAILVHTMSSVQCNRSEEVSTILFWGYMLGILAIPLWLTLFLYIVQQDYRSSD